MHTTSQLIVNVVELLDDPGSRKRLAFSEAVGGLSLELARVRDSEELGFDLTLEAVEGGILVRGSVELRYVEICRRCLEENTRDLRFEAAELYRRPQDRWEEGYVIDGETIDLRHMVQENVVLNLPIHPVCRENCLGLCTRCGANLNDGPCGCPEEVVDMRWAALRDLLDEA